MSWLRTHRNPTGRWDADVSLDGITSCCFNASTEAQVVQGAVEQWEQLSFQMAFASRRRPSFGRQRPSEQQVSRLATAPRRKAGGGGPGLFGCMPPPSNTGGKLP